MRHLCLLLALTALSCRAAPSREVALAAIRSASHGADTALVEVRVWQDGPPWFSCAEVLSKLDGRSDTAFVHGPLGNWRALVLSGWIVLRDTAHGRVTEPGWCAAKPTEAGAPRISSWRFSPGDTFPSGSPKRGWIAPIGHQKLEVLESPVLTGADTAIARYIATVVVNDNGVAMRADRDTARFEAMLQRLDRSWRVLSIRPSHD